MIIISKKVGLSISKKLDYFSLKSLIILYLIDLYMFITYQN